MSGLEDGGSDVEMWRKFGVALGLMVRFFIVYIGDDDQDGKGEGGRE